MSKNVRIIICVDLILLIFTLKLFAQDEVKNPSFEKVYNKARSFRNIDTDSILYYIDLAIEIGYESNIVENQIDALIFKSQTNLKIGNYKTAIDDSKLALSLASDRNLKFKKKECLTVIGAVYQTAGYFEEALDYFFRAKKIDLINSPNYYDVILNYYIGSLYIDINKVPEGRIYLKNSISLSINNGNEKGAFKSLMRLSDTFQNLDSINYYLNLCEDILAKNENLSYEKVVFFNNNALMSKSFGDYSTSKKLYEDAIELCINNQFSDYLVTLYNNYAYLMMALDNYDSAQLLLGKALDLSKKYDLLDVKVSVYDSYSDFYINKHNYEYAFYYKDSSDKILRIVEKNKQIQQSLFLSTVFETDKKEKEILLQKNKNFTLLVYLIIVILILVLLTIFLLYSRQKLQLNKAKVISLEKDKKLNVANAMIEGQDAERKRLAMDLHDGLGASLGALRLAFDSELKDNVRYHEMTNLVDDIRQSVRDMSHRMMPTRLDKLGLIPSINNMAASLSNSGSFKVDFKTNISKRLAGNLEINIYYLIFELVNNAIKHSNGNAIFVELIDHDDLISLSVIDNGTDFKSDELSDGMGLKNVRARIQYMDGELYVDANGQETIFMVEIPVRK